jgi:hypothetical protein
VSIQIKVRATSETVVDDTEIQYQRIPCVVYYESIKRELEINPISECRYDERLKTKAEEFTRLGYTGLFGELEHLKIKTRLIDERFTSVMGECVI